MPADAAPVPPADLPDRHLPLRVLPAGTVLHRIHGRADDALFFGPPGADPRSRFDDPDGEYGICYLGMTPEAALVETLLRSPTRQLIAWSDIEARSLARVEVRRRLRLVELCGAGLRRIGATAEVTSTRDYGLSRAWSRALWQHPDRPHGLLYRCRHDDSEEGVALFDRAMPRIALAGTIPLARRAGWLGRMSDRYGFGLTL